MKKIEHIKSWIEPEIYIENSTIGSFATWIRRKSTIVNSKIENGIFIGYCCNLQNCIINKCTLIATKTQIIGSKNKPAVVGQNCWIGGGVKIEGGITIGEGSVIGAGSHITIDVPPYSIIFGRESTVLKRRQVILDSNPDFSDFLEKIRNNYEDWLIDTLNKNATLYKAGKNSFISAKLTAGPNLTLGENVLLMGQPDEKNIGGITIGTDVNIKDGSVLEGAGGIIIKDRCSIENNVLILTTSHDHRYLSLPDQRAPIFIDEDVSIGANSILIPGITVGKGAKILSNSVVTRDVMPYSTVFGVPAKYI